MAINQQITNDLTWVGVQDPQLKVFDIIMETEYGTTTRISLKAQRKRR